MGHTAPTEKEHTLVVLRPPTAFEISTADNPQMAKALQDQVASIKTSLCKLVALKPYQKAIEQELTSFLQPEDTRNFESLNLAIVQLLPKDCPPDLKQSIEHCILAPMLSTRQQALSQHAGLIKAYQSEGIEVICLPNHSGSDAVFATDTGEQVGEIFLLGQLKNKRRHGEEDCTLKLLKRLKIPVHRLPNRVLEGGDMIYSSFYKTLFVGEGFRNTGQPSQHIQSELTDTTVLGLALQLPQFYHLDCCFNVLNRGHMLLYPPGLSQKALSEVTQLTHQHNVPPPLELTEQEASRFASNLVCIDDTVFVAQDALSKASAQQLERWGYELRPVPYDIFHLSGGSVRCSTLTLRTPGHLSSKNLAP